jgi:hypothetical protein
MEKREGCTHPHTKNAYGIAYMTARRSSPTEETLLLTKNSGLSHVSHRRPLVEQRRLRFASFGRVA